MRGLRGGCFPRFKEIVGWLAFHHVMNIILWQNCLKLLHVETGVEVGAEDQRFKFPLILTSDSLLRESRSGFPDSMVLLTMFAAHMRPNGFDVPSIIKPPGRTYCNKRS